jgi:hypothetical protein
MPITEVKDGWIHAWIPWRRVLPANEFPGDDAGPSSMYWFHLGGYKRQRIRFRVRLSDLFVYVYLYDVHDYLLCGGNLAPLCWSIKDALKDGNQQGLHVSTGDNPCYDVQIGIRNTFFFVRAQLARFLPHAHTERDILLQRVAKFEKEQWPKILALLQTEVRAYQQEQLELDDAKRGIFPVCWEVKEEKGNPDPRPKIIRFVSANSRQMVMVNDLARAIWGDHQMSTTVHEMANLHMDNKAFYEAGAPSDLRLNIAIDVNVALACLRCFVHDCLWKKEQDGEKALLLNALQLFRRYEWDIVLSQVGKHEQLMLESRQHASVDVLQVD